jgi:hypothetical protein
MKMTDSNIHCQRDITLLIVCLALTFGSVACLAKAVPMGTAFTYQGRLIDDNIAADGFYDFQFELYDDPNTGTQQGPTVDINDTNVADGYFTVELDFGSDVFNGEARWLDIGVRPSESNDPNYTPLSSRQEVTPTPYALQTRGIFVDSNDNVGIGTTDPSATLDVCGTLEINSIAEEDAILVLRQDGVAKAQIRYDDSENNFAMGYQGYHATQLVMSSNGNVGIGTTSPDEKLHVAGHVLVKNPSGGTSLILQNSGGSYDSLMFWMDSAGALDYYIGQTEDNGDLRVHNYAAGEQSLRLHTNGDIRIGNSGLYYKASNDNVGIGTTSPAGKLDVNGSIYQRGSVLHADYVFEPDYKLESIDEHSQFMWSNKHLPAITQVNINEDGQEIVEIGGHRRGIVEELEKAHIYIEQLHKRLEVLETKLANMEN